MNKVWIYQSEKQISAAQVIEINQKIADFMKSWESHGRALNGKGEVLLNHFIKLEVDQSIFDASGCSIDKSVAFIKSLEKEYGLDLFERTKMAYQDEDGIHFIGLNSIKFNISEGNISPYTTIFNNTITTSQEFEDGWQVMLGKSGYYRFAG